MAGATQPSELQDYVQQNKLKQKGQMAEKWGEIQEDAKELLLKT